MSGVFGKGAAPQSASPVTSLRLQTATRGRPIPMAYGRPRIAANVIWYGDLVATAHEQSNGGKGGGGGKSKSYTYKASLILGLCEGVINGIPRVWRQKEVFTAPPPHAQNAGGTVDACAQIGLSCAVGDYTQQAPGWMTTKHAAQALGYRGLSYVAGSNYGLGDNADLLNHSFEIDTKTAYSATIRDANPTDVIVDLLTNPYCGAGFPANKLGDMSLFSAYCVANNIFVSPAYLEQAAAREMLQTLLTITNAGAIYSQGKLRFVPFGDATASAHGVTFTPDITPVYDLTDDDFIGDAGDDPIHVTRTSNADAYNSVRVKFYNRANNYNEEIVEAKDQANIELYGLRAMDVMDIKELCDATAARSVAQLTLQRSLYIRNTFEFQLGWSKALLEPMDLVTLTDSGMGMDKLPVRILSIEEDEFGYLTVVAEEFPQNACNAATYSTQPTSGYAANFNAAPDPVTGAVVFEAPLDLCESNGALEVWVAAGGASNYGGCEVWASIDNATYKQVGKISGQSRFGTLSTTMVAQATAGITTQTVSLSLAAGGQMLSGTLDDAKLLNTLCYVDGEFLAYETATLTGVDAYTLGTLNRGAYRSGQGQHEAGKSFVRIDDAVAKIALSSDYVGRRLYLKLVAFNQFGGGLQALADVSPIAFDVTGRFYKMPPPDISFLKAVVKAGGVREFAFNADISSKELQKGGGYRIRHRTAGSAMAWADCVKLHEGLISVSPYETNHPASGIYDFGVVAVDARGNESAPLFASGIAIGDLDFTDAKHGTSVAAGNMDYLVTQISASIAANKAETAQNSANAANTEIANIASDNILSKGEKSAIVLDYNAILDEESGIIASANAYGVSSTLYVSAVSALIAYLNGLTPSYSDASTDTPIVGATFRSKFASVYAARQSLENGISAQAKALADAAQSTGNAAASAASAAATAASIAQTTANAANADLANIASDNVLSKGEKSAVILDYNAIVNEQSGIDAQADLFGQSRLAYDSAVSALTSYLGGLSPAYNSATSDTPIVGATFRQKFADVYTAKQVLLNAISARAKTLADGAQGTANAASTAASTAQTAANAANTDLANIASDNILSKGEKSAVILDYNAIVNEQSGIDAQADLFGQSRLAYDSAVSALTAYLGSLSPVYNSATSDTPIVGATFRQKFADVYTAKQVLLNAISARAKTLADGAQGTANAASTAASTAQTAANAANTDLANIASDNVLSKGEKSAVILDYNAIVNEQAGIDVQADLFGQSRTAYDGAVSALTAYLGGLSPAYNSATSDTPIVGATFRQKFADVYTAKQVLLNAISARAKTLADGAQGTANAANTAASNAQVTANAATTALANIASDNVLSAGEKPAVVVDYSVILNEQSGIDAQADAFSQSRTAYDAAVGALTAYLTGLSPAYNSFTSDTTIVGSTFRQKFTDVYVARQALLNAIATQAGSGYNIVNSAITSLKIAPNQISKYGTAYALTQVEVANSSLYSTVASFAITLTGLQQSMFWASCIVAGAHIGTSSNFDSYFDANYWKFNAADTTIDFRFLLFGSVSGIYTVDCTQALGVPHGNAITASVQGLFAGIPAQLYSVQLQARAKQGGENVGIRQVSLLGLEVMR